ncbi:phosphotransferase family protein [Paenibacillus sp. WLX2291]|uniref:phosphotransferase family protein n=1 Tax=Paenibacillus sp. WLX2291 TaxID=3296934 RepID=UPI00398455B7
MKSVDWTQLVQHDGQLDPQLAIHSEVIYTGLHGHSVQRFWLEDGSSYIYKPLPQGEDSFREIRAYVQVLPLLESLPMPPRYPQLLVCAAPAEEQAGIHQWIANAEHEASLTTSFIVHPLRWIVMEDIGVLNHVHSDKQLLQIVEQMVCWHRVDVSRLTPFPQVGQKPPLPDIASSVISRWQQAEEILLQLPALCRVSSWNASATDVTEIDDIRQQPDIWLRWLQQDIAETVQRLSSQRAVLLHGDLHAGNYGVNPQGQLMVLDWEHSHIGSLFWDVYHLLDLSHPLFPRSMTPSLRHSLLEHYWFTDLALNESDRPVAPDRGAAGLTSEYVSFAKFEQDYLVYAIVYSIWMLLLIQKDLLQEPPIWPRAQLLAQQMETTEHLEQCIHRWLTIRKSGYA